MDTRHFVNPTVSGGGIGFRQRGVVVCSGHNGSFQRERLRKPLLCVELIQCGGKKRAPHSFPSILASSCTTRPLNAIASSPHHESNFFVRQTTATFLRPFRASPSDEIVTLDDISGVKERSVSMMLATDKIACVEGTKRRWFLTKKPVNSWQETEWFLFCCWHISYSCVAAQI